MSNSQIGPKKHQLLNKIFKRNKIYPSSIGCLGVHASCGLDLWDENQSTRGIVTDRDNLTDMKEQYGSSKLYAHSLTSFRLPTKLQAMYALDTQFQSLNGTKNLEKVLQKCYDHLEPYGILVFDILLDKAFDTSKDGQSVKLEHSKVIITESSLKKGVLHTAITQFNKNEDGTYTRIDETLKQHLISFAELKKLLKGFESVVFVDHHGRKATTKAKHVIVVAQKGRNKE